MPYAHRQEVISPSGVEFAVSLRLLHPLSNPSSLGHQVLGHLVVARSSLLRIFEVRQQFVTLREHVASSVDTNGIYGRKGTEAVEGEVAMDIQGDGFVSIAEVKLISRAEQLSRPTETRLHLLREHRLHGIVTGLEKVQTMASADDGLDRLIVSFKDAKIALMEWSDAAHDITTVSIHTYERAPQLVSSEVSTFRSFLRVDPLSRCAALALPRDSVAILPFYQSQAELDNLDLENDILREVPYSPSFILDFPAEVDSKIGNIIDFVFLPGFNNTTLAILYQKQQTWTGRLNEFKDTVSLSIITLDFVTHSYPNITRIDGLPYDCSNLLACPASYGGVVIQSPDAIIHVDQASRVTALSVNGWANRISAIQALHAPDDIKTAPANHSLKLEGSHLTFVDEKSILLFLADGVVHVITVVVDGRAVSRLTIEPAIAQCVPPSILRTIGSDHVFVGSVVGPSAVLQATWHYPQTEQSTEMPASVPLAADDDLDDDLYGDSAYAVQLSANGDVFGKTSSSEAATILRLTWRDTLPAWGSIADMVFSVNKEGDRPAAELVACTGASGTSAFTRFQATLPTRTKRKVHALGGNRGIWSLAVRREVNVGGSWVEQPTTSLQEDTIIVSSHATPSPGVSRVFGTTTSGDVQILSRSPGVTLAVGTFFQRTCILQVFPSAIRLLRNNGQEKQVLAEMDVISASISDPFILVQRKEGTISLYSGDTPKGTVKPNPLFSSTGCVCSSIFTDRQALWKVHHNSGTPPNATQTGTLESVLSGDHVTQWLIIHRNNGNLEILCLPSLEMVFVSKYFSSLPAVVDDSGQDNQTEDGPSVASEVDKLIVASIGDESPRPHVVILTKSNFVVVYECVPMGVPRPELPRSALNVKLVKTFSQVLGVLSASSTLIPRNLVPFTTKSGTLIYNGVFCTGVKPFWLIIRRDTPPRLYPSSHAVVFGFTSTSAFRSRSDFIAHTEEGPSLEQWVQGVQLGAELPYKTVHTERPYSAVAFDPETQLLVAASMLERDFATFDEEGNVVWVPDAPNLPLPQCGTFSIELISPAPWETLDGYEFPQYEQLTALACIPLESSSTELGLKNFIVAATSVDRGEDLAARGAVYVFEIVEVVPKVRGTRAFELRLRCRDDSKGPVTALCGMNGYLISSMGQKIFVRGFDLEERLVGVAFLDVGVFVTSLRTMKNLLLVGDALKGTWFVGFQEDPFKLVILSKGRQPSAVSNADFFFGVDSQLSFMVTDEEGVLRIFDYNPRHVDTNSGQRLLCRSEFHGQSDHHTVLTISRRKDDESDQNMEGSAAIVAQSVLIYATLDGAIAVVKAVGDATFKRLSLLQGQLVRNVQHVAGLNPRAYRTVRNDALSRPLTKGILDGELLNIFDGLELERQVEMTKQIGTDREVVLGDLAALLGLF